MTQAQWAADNDAAKRRQAIADRQAREAERQFLIRLQSLPREALEREIARRGRSGKERR